MLKKVILLILLAAATVTGLWFLNTHGYLAALNPQASLLIAGPPDIACKTDNDCEFKQTVCGNPCIIDAVNKDWKPSCPFIEKKKQNRPCYDSEIPKALKCVDNHCKKRF